VSLWHGFLHGYKNHAAPRVLPDTPPAKKYRHSRMMAGLLAHGLKHADQPSRLPSGIMIRRTPLTVAGAAQALPCGALGSLFTAQVKPMQNHHSCGVAGHAVFVNESLNRENSKSMADDSSSARHAAKMKKRKAVQDAEVASKTLAEKGLLIVNTGPGKGKSTAAFGLALRAIGAGMDVGIVQFIKGAWETGERQALSLFKDRIVWKTMGEGFTWETQDLNRDIAAARAGWDAAKAMMADPRFGLVILDELNIALRYDYLPVEEVIGVLQARRPMLHVVVTGRNAKPLMIEAADLVTEMTLVKHHFAAGVKAQKGIEF
jgi:cob(I)alamin adenosyltransferase